MARATFLTYMETTEVEVVTVPATYDDEGELLTPAEYEWQTVPTGLPHLPLEDGEDLSYEYGTKSVKRDFDVDTPEEDDEVLKHVVIRDPETGEITEEYYIVRRLVELPHPRGGIICTSEAPPSAPPDTVIVTLASTEAMLNTIHDRLFAEDARLGLYSEIDLEAHTP